MEPGEARLLACLAANLDAHFAELVTAYQHRLYVFILRQTGSVQDAEDIVQETFLQAYFALGNYPSWRVRTLRLQAWLYRIALNLFYSRMRLARLSLVSLGSEEGRLTSFTAEVAQEEQPESLFESQEARQEISDLLEQPMGTVKSYLHRGVRLLRKLATETSEKDR